MKRLLTLCTFLALALSCAKEGYIPGEKDLQDCYKVYFPEQAGYGDFMLRSTASREFTYKACRKRTDGAITVPVVVNASSPVFSVDPIVFADGEAETTFSVRFDGAEEQVPLSFSLEIQDPQYASTYLLERKYVSFTVLIGNRKITPNLRSDWRFIYYSNYYYVYTSEGYYGFWTLPASAGNPEDPDFVRQVIEDYNAKLEDYYAGSRPNFNTDYSTTAWALFTGSSHYGATPASSGGSSESGDYIAFMFGVTASPYCTGDYAYTSFTL